MTEQQPDAPALPGDDEEQFCAVTTTVDAHAFASDNGEDWPTLTCSRKPGHGGLHYDELNMVEWADRSAEDPAAAYEPAETADAESPAPAPVPELPVTATTTAFQARWPVTASVLRSQVRAAIEHWASGDAGGEDPAGVVMAVVAPFIESLVAEGLRAGAARTEAAETTLAELRSVLREGGQDLGTVRRRALAIAVGTKIRERSDEKGPGNG